MNGRFLRNLTLSLSLQEREPEPRSWEESK